MTAPPDGGDPACKGKEALFDLMADLTDHGRSYLRISAAQAEAELRRAKEACAGCQVRVACLAGALERGERYGMWGGELATAFPRDGDTALEVRTGFELEDLAEELATLTGERRLSVAFALYEAIVAEAAGTAMTVAGVLKRHDFSWAVWTACDRAHRKMEARRKRDDEAAESTREAAAALRALADAA